MIGDLTDAIRLAPQEAARVYRLRAMAYYRLQDLDRALSDATSAVELGGNAALDLALRSQILAARHEPDRAIDDLDAAVRVNPRLADLYVLRADARRAKSDKDRALADLETAIRIDPTNAQHAGALAWSRKGDLRYLSDELDLAANSYDEAIRLDPGRAEFYSARAAILSAAGEAKRAAQDFAKALALAPNDPAVFGQRGVARFAEGDFAGAAEDFSELSQRAPNAYAAIWLYLARARAETAQNAGEADRLLMSVKSAAWPTPVVELLLGERAADAVAGAANGARQLCDAKFYVGQWFLLKDDRANASAALEAAAANCPRDSAERRVAIAILKRLKT